MPLPRIADAVDEGLYRRECEFEEVVIITHKVNAAASHIAMSIYSESLPQVSSAGLAIQSKYCSFTHESLLGMVRPTFGKKSIGISPRSKV